MSVDIRRWKQRMNFYSMKNTYHLPLCKCCILLRAMCSTSVAYFFIKTAEMLLIFMQFGFAGARSINVDRRRETAFEFTSSSRKRQEGDRESQTEFRLIYLFVN